MRIEPMAISPLLLALLTVTAASQNPGSLVTEAVVEAPINRVAMWMEAELLKDGYRVTGQHDIQASLATASLSVEPTIVLETCKPSTAEQALRRAPSLASMMPCRIALTERSGTTRASFLRPSAIATSLTNDKATLSLMAAVEESLSRSVKAATRKQASLVEAWFDVNLPYKAALYATSTGNPKGARASMDRFEGQWVRFVSRFRDRPSAPYGADTDWVASLRRVSASLRSARESLGAGNVTQAHERLEPIRVEWADARERNGVRTLTDALTRYHEPMEAIVLASKDRLDVDAVRSHTGDLKNAWQLVIEAKMPPLPKADGENRQRLLDEVAGSVEAIQQALDSGDEARLAGAGRRLKPAFMRLYLQYG